MRGKQVLTIDQAREVSQRLGIPVHLLRFGLGGEDPAKRRDFGKAVALAVLAWPRLTETDEKVVPALAGVTRAQRRLDATMCARERVLQGSPQFRRGYVGPVTAQVHGFDQRLRATFS